MPSLKDGATSTFDEAHDLRHYCKKNRLKHIILVTDNSHTRRALYAFQKVFRDTDILVQAAGAPNDIYTERTWWHADMGISTYIDEGIKYLVYLLYDRNVPFVKNY